MVIACLALALALVSAGAQAAATDQAQILQVGAIAGHVHVSGSGAPIAGATVRVYGNSILVASTATDAAGAYVVSALPVADYDVTASKPGFVSQRVDSVPVTSGGTTTVNFQLVASGVISGQVRERFTQTPIAGAVVAASLGGVVRGVATTNSQGIYQIASDLPAGTYVVGAAKAGYLPQTKNNIAVTSGAATYVNFALLPLGPLAGQVRDAETLYPLTGAAVNVYEGAILVDTTLTVTPLGVYTFGSELLPGTYTVIASKVGYVRQIRPNVTVTGGSTAYANFALEPSGRLKGQVVDKDTLHPIIGATVKAYEDGILRATAVTVAPWGVYQIVSNVPSGTYLVVASAPGYVTQGKGNIVVAADATTYVNFKLQPQ